VGLLSRLIKEAEYIIQNVTHKKMVIKSVALKKAKAVSRIYYSSAKKSKELLSSTTSSLLKIARQQLSEAKENATELTETNIKRYQDLKEIGSKIIAQTAARLEGLKIGSRILSYHEPHTRALPKGKIGKPCEFGSKLSLSMAANGYISSHALHPENVADISTLENVISAHKSKFGNYFEAAAADRAYYDEELIAKLEQEHKIILAIPHKKRRDRLLEDSRQDLYDKRAAIEAKISEAKRMYGLSKSYYSGFDGDRMWAALAIMATNMRKLLRDIDGNPKLMHKFST
jgi:transposase, IS5 family